MSLHLACPAASPVAPPSHGPSVLCGVLELANEGAQIGGFRSRGQVDPVMSGRRDPSVVRFQCAGDGVPGSAKSYCACAIWRAQRDAEHASRRGPDALRDSANRVRGPHHEGVAVGLDMLGARGA